jgi:hypothetical protein
MGATILALAVIFASTTLGGCASVDGYQKSPEPSSVIKSRHLTYYGVNADAAYYSASGDARQVLRDQLVYGKMQALEDDFIDFERSLNSAGNYVSLGSDLTVLVLNGIAATTGTAATKSALSAASAGVVGAQGAVNKDLYYQKTLSALICQMQANREKARLTIIQNLKQSDSAYPLNAAEIDLKRLEEAGSLVNAVNDIAQQASTSKQNSQAQIQVWQTLISANTESASQLQAWLYQNGKVNQANYDALQAWLNKQPESGLNGQNYPPAAFVSGDTSTADLEPIRVRAVNDLTLKIPH